MVRLLKKPALAIFLCILVISLFAPEAFAPAATKYMGSGAVTKLGGTDYRNYSDAAPASWTSVIRYAKSANKYVFDPAALQTDTPVSGNPDAGVPAGYGWATNYTFAGRMPAAGWNFSVKLTSSHNDAGYFGFVAYKNCSNINTQLFSTFNSTDVLTGSGIATAYTHSYNVSQLDVNNCYLKVEYWMNVTSATSNNNARVTMTHDSTSWIQFPASDNTTPKINVISPQNISYNATSVWANLTLDEDGNWCARSLDGAANTSMLNSSGNWNSLLSGLAEAGHNVSFWCNDTAGNMNASLPVFFTVDLTPPTISILSPENATYYSRTVWLNVSANEPIHTWWYSINSTPNVIFSPNITMDVSPGGNNITVYANDTAGNIGSATVFFTFLSELEANLTEPDYSIVTDIIQNTTFLVNATVFCRNGACGSVAGTVRYNASSPVPDTEISAIFGAQPLFINEPAAAATKSCNNNPLAEGSFCNLTWIINATGALNSGWTLGVNFSSDSAGAPPNRTENATVSIVPCVVDINIIWNEIEFGGMLLPNSLTAASGNAGKLYNISVNEGSCDTDVYVKGEDFRNKTMGYSFGIGNLSWSNTSEDYASSYNMTESYAPVKINAAGKTNATMWYWVNVPPVFAGNYNTTVYIGWIRNGYPIA